MISIIIPTLNEEKLIRETLSRLKSSMTLPHEIIISDGKSTDTTVEIARRLADNVVVYSGTPRQTIAQGRNAGARVATGDFLVFLDADCRIENPDKLFTLALESFKNDPRLVGQSAWIKVFPENETFGDNVVWTFMNYSNVLLNLVGIGGAPGEFQMIRKEAFERVSGYNEQLIATEDYDMFNRLSKIGRVRLNTALVVFHSGRHGHVLGWPKLLFLWFMNTLSYTIRGKSFSREWTVIR